VIKKIPYGSFHYLSDRLECSFHEKRLEKVHENLILKNNGKNIIVFILNGDALIVKINKSKAISLGICQQNIEQNQTK
jgi:hypothetical protein